MLELLITSYEGKKSIFSKDSKKQEEEGSPLTEVVIADSDIHIGFPNILRNKQR
jgi:hypothetical protein